MFEFLILTLYLPKFLTLHVRIASRPAGYVTFVIADKNSGSNSTPWLLSEIKSQTVRALSTDSGKP